MSTTGHHALPERVQELEAEADALTLRLSGLSYRRIAETQSCSVSTAHDRVDRALRAYVPQEPLARQEAAVSPDLSGRSPSWNNVHAHDLADTCGADCPPLPKHGPSCATRWVDDDHRPYPCDCGVTAPARTPS